MVIATANAEGKSESAIKCNHSRSTLHRATLWSDSAIGRAQPDHRRAGPGRFGRSRDLLVTRSRERDPLPAWVGDTLMN